MARDVLILEDNSQWASLLKGDLRASDFKAQICQPSANHFLQNAPRRGPYEVLVDLGMNLNWLDDLADKRHRNKLNRARFWVMTGAVDVDIAYLRKRYQHVPFEERWFDKLDQEFLSELREELNTQHPGATVTGKAAWLPPSDFGWLQAYPNPIRVVDRAGNVLWTNDGWSANPYTPALRPSELANAFDREVGEWQESRRRGPLPAAQDSSLHGYTTVSHYLLREQIGRDGTSKPYLMQWIVPLEMGHEDSLSEIVTRILEDLTHHLFSRARFYRVCPLPGTEGTITLEYNSGVIAQPNLIPHTRPLTGEILDRIRGYIGRPRNPQTLVCNIFEEEGHGEDGEWQHWNEVVGTKGMHNSLEVPILDRRSPLGISGVLICDCRDKKGLDGRTGYIPLDAEDWLENNLLHAVVQLSRALRKDKKQRLIRAREQVLEATTPLFAANGRENLEAVILDQAMRLAGAEGGILLAELPEVGSGFEIRVARGEDQHLVAKTLPRDANSLPAIIAWKKQCILNVPDFSRSNIWREMKETGHWRKLSGSKDDESVIEDWLSKLGSVLAAPLRRGDRVIGAVTLHHAEPMHFNDDHSHILRQLLDIAAPVLEAELENEDRNIWHAEVIHRLGARINTIASNLELLDLLGEEHREARTRDAQTQAHVLRDLVRRLRDEDHTWNRNANFALDWNRRLTKIRNKVSEMKGDCRREIEWGEQAFLEEPVLCGDEDAFEMTIEDLLSNACRHAEGNGSVKLTAELDDTRLLVRICNPGILSQADEEILFRMERRGSQAKGEGLGMGLALARRAARYHDGEVRLDTENTAAGLVCFCVEWPLNFVFH